MPAYAWLQPDEKTVCAELHLHRCVRVQIPPRLKAESPTPPLRAQEGQNVTPPWSPSPQTPTPCGLTSPYVGAASQAWKETAHQSREPGDVGCDSQLRKGSCAATPKQHRQSHVSCPSVPALTIQAPKTPRRLKTLCAELADVRVLDCPLLGRHRRTHVNQGLHWQLWRTISLLFRGKRGFGGAEGCRSSSSAPTSMKTTVPTSSRDALRQKNQKPMAGTSCREIHLRDEKGWTRVVCWSISAVYALTHVPSGAAFWLWWLLEPLAQPIPTPPSSIHSPWTQPCQKDHAQLRHRPHFAKLTIEAALKAVIFLITT